MARARKPKADHAVRAVVGGRVQGVGLRAATIARARELGVLGWVRNADGGEVLLHAEGPAEAVEALLAALRDGPGAARVDDLEVEVVEAEGHEQFAVRGVSAGRFEVVEGGASRGGGFELRLQVDGGMRAWALPKGPTMDPAVKRMAFEAGGEERDPEGSWSLWDSGDYEQGGCVPWPEAIERGHAVMVLHGKRLRGGFALQRIQSGPRPRWLLVKRSDEHARRGSDVIAEAS